MEKNRNRKPAAMRVYEEGVKRFPNNAKLREDAGILAASLGDSRTAIRFLEESLSLCRTTEQGGEKGVLLALARTHYQVDTLPSLRQSINYYEEAVELFGRGRTQLPDVDLLRLNIARIRTKHHRGNLCTHTARLLPEVLDCAYLGQLAELMKSNAAWSLFRNLFRDKRELEDILKDVTPVRNDFAHFRVVPDRELDRCRLRCEDLLAIISKHGSSV